MNFALVASGSKGNCFVLRHQDTQIIIDCGTTKRYLTHSFHTLGIDYLQSDALLLTHGHKDHTSQLKMFSPIDVWASFALEDRPDQHWIKPYQQFQVKSLTITVLPCSHDAENTIGYLIESNQERLVYITDTGYVHQDVIPLITGADYYVLESNHDVQTLMKTSRPYPIKMRILSDSGHLCNEDCARILSQVVKENTKSVFLAHLSEEANHPALATRTVLEQLATCPLQDNFVLKAAGQYEILTGGISDEKTRDCCFSSAGLLECFSHQ